MRTHLRAAICAVLLAMPATSLFASDFRNVLTDYAITGWSQKDGLAPGVVSNIVQDRDGYLWVGTSVGLYRFDGAQMTPWDAFGSGSLPRARVSALAIDSQDGIWVALGGAQPTLARIRNDKAELFPATQGFDGSSVNFFLMDSTGKLWMGTPHGLYSLVSDVEVEYWMKLDGHGLPGNANVYSALEDRTGGLLVGTSLGIFRQPLHADSFQVVEDFLKPVNRRSDNVPYSLGEDAQGRLFATDRIQGYRLVGASHEHIAFNERGRGARLLKDREGNLWIGTTGQGLWRVAAADTNHAAPETVNALTGLLGDGVLGLLEDRDGNIWVGTTQGLNRLTPKKIESLTNLGLVLAVEALRDGSVHVATVDGLLRFPRGDSRAAPIHITVPGDRLSALHLDRDDATWVATNRGVSRVAAGAMASVPVPGTEALHSVEAMSSDGKDGAWLSDTAEGLVHWSGGRVQPAPAGIPWRGASLSCMFTDRGGSVWLAFDNGRLSVITPDGQVRTFGAGDGLSGLVNAIYQDDADVLWMAGDFGLSRFSGGRFETARTGRAFPAFSFTALTRDNANLLWGGTVAGILRFSADDLKQAVADPKFKVRYRLFERADGLGGFPLPYYMSRRAARATDGRLWFVTSRGLTIVNPSRLPRTVQPGPVKISSVLVDERPLPPGQTTLDERTSRLAINYTVLDLTSPFRIRFRYRLDGFDTDWNDAGLRRQAFYTNLPPRSYRFRVMATSDDDSWTEAEAVWAFSVAPRFYQTSWFYPAIATAFCLLLWLGWRMRLGRMRRQFTLVLAERARLSREIHDTLLQGMVGIALQLDAMSKQGAGADDPGQLVRMRRHLEDYIREARQSIAHLRSAKLQTHDLASALRGSAISAINGEEISLAFAISGDPKRFPSAAEAGVLRIGEEAISNAIRHGKPLHLDVRLDYEPSSVKLVVRDDGHGFDPTELDARADHFGLATMKERAVEIGATLDIKTGPHAGTTVSLTVPMR